MKEDIKFSQIQLDEPYVSTKTILQGQCRYENDLFELFEKSKKFYEKSLQELQIIDKTIQTIQSEIIYFCFFPRLVHFTGSSMVNMDIYTVTNEESMVYLDKFGPGSR